MALAKARKQTTYLDSRVARQPLIANAVTVDEARGWSEPRRVRIPGLAALARVKAERTRHGATSCEHADHSNPAVSAEETGPEGRALARGASASLRAGCAP